MPTIKRGKKVQIIIQKKSKFIDLRRIAKNNVDVLNGVLMTDDFKGYKSMKVFITYRIIIVQSNMLMGLLIPMLLLKSTLKFINPKYYNHN